MEQPCGGFVLLNGAQCSEASTLDNGFLSMLGMNCDEKTKFQVLFKCSLTTRLWSQTELAVG
jgi:hypothetical protein